ncbi:hypothetical protein [Halorussus caseinilyticus]|uniref:hypothetical protein n=1 Tax=Halorussus caseinilyticus TaxID=3034025 RepID=UPI0023E8F581|nr:hypothetical protein [Halorussus sp. DT72]
MTSDGSGPAGVTRRALLSTGVAVGAVGLAGARPRQRDGTAGRTRRRDARDGQDGQDRREVAIPPRLPSAIDVDAENGTVTLPLYSGQAPTGTVHYVVFETTSLRVATDRGLNWSPKLANALDTNAVQRASGRQPRARNRESAGVTFTATPNFALERQVVPGPEGFPLGGGTNPGARGERYTPLFVTRRGTVYNAPHVANDSGEHDAIVEIDRDGMEVTMRLTAGFYEGQRVLYASTEASSPELAALEAATYAPALNAAPSAGDRTTATSAREPIIPVVNGPMGADDPDRQGLRSAVAGEGSPLNVVAEQQTCGDPSFREDCDALFYSPLWDVHPVEWTAEAIDAGRRRRLTSHQEVIAAFRRERLATAAPDGTVNDQLGGLRAAGALVNCPLVLTGPEDG